MPGVGNKNEIIPGVALDNSFDEVNLPNFFFSFSYKKQTRVDKIELQKAITFINALKDPSKKDNAFKELNQKRELIANLAPVLWHTTGTIAIL